MNKIRVAQLILLAGFILLIINLRQLDFNNLLQDKGIVMGIISNALLIVGMVISIKELKKTKNQ
jgi:hypothetical protein